MKFLVDAQLPPALAEWLRRSGHEATHVQDLGLRESDDGSICAYARNASIVIVTKDEDFATRAMQRPDCPAIVWLRVGNTTNRVLRSWIEARIPDIVKLISQGSRVVEVV